MCPPLARITILSLDGIESIKLSSVDWGIVFHSISIKLRSLSMEVGPYSSTCIFTIAQRFSIGFKSGLPEGQLPRTLQ
jgi:hypothetical protein